MSILVTGAAGFVGLNLVRHLAANGQSVIALARRAPDEAALRFLGAWGERVRWATVDVRNRSAMIDLAANARVKVIIHAATVTAPRHIEMGDPTMVLDINIGGTVNALEAARICGARRFVFVSSTVIYGAAANPMPVTHESAPLAITSLYTIAKQTGEALCRRYTTLFDLSTVSGRLGSAYGPMERTTLSRSGMSVIYQLAHAAVRGEDIAVFGADRSRDFCYITDVAEAFARLALADTLRYDVYNVAGERAATVREVCDALCTLAPDFSWSECEQQVADVVAMPGSERNTLDLSRLRDDVGFVPRYSLLDGLTEYLAWLRSGWLSV